MNPATTQVAAQPTLPCAFRLLSRDGELLATVHGDWTLDDDAVRQCALDALHAERRLTPRTQRALQHTSVRAGMGGGKS